MHVVSALSGEAQLSDPVLGWRPVPRSIWHVIVLIAAGNFLYIAAADLVPELHQERGGWMALWQMVIVLAGIALMLGVRSSVST